MWSFMLLPMPSFPHTLHIAAKWRPLTYLFWLLSIIDITRSSSSSRSPEKLPGIATVLFSSALWILLLGACVLKEVFGIFVSVLKKGKSVENWIAIM